MRHAFFFIIKVKSDYNSSKPKSSNVLYNQNQMNEYQDGTKLAKSNESFC